MRVEKVFMLQSQNLVTECPWELTHSAMSAELFNVISFFLRCSRTSTCAVGAQQLSLDLEVNVACLSE